MSKNYQQPTGEATHGVPRAADDPAQGRGGRASSGEDGSASPASGVRIKSTGYSSQRYGACEVCGLHCSEVFMFTDGNRYAFDGARHVFGHEQCMRTLAIEAK